MSTYKKRPEFMTSQAGLQALEVLQAMVADAGFHTESSYSADAGLYPDHVMPFVDKHMRYLRSHPAIDPQQYIANLRLMTKRA